MNMLFEGLKEKGAMIIVPSSAVDTMNLGGLMGMHRWRSRGAPNCPLRGTGDRLMPDKPDRGLSPPGAEAAGPAAFKETVMIEVENLVKHYANVKGGRWRQLFRWEGEIFGLLGPNGAGKTTTSTIMDIIKPDSGTVRLMGQPMTEASKARIGYLPEERGLYKSFRLLECLTYLGALKGMPAGEAAAATALLAAEQGWPSMAGARCRS